ncbi:Phospholipase D/Transphosphatidylase [Verrucomicrobia bacterium]|nr:Phospholipase D/Transphosphatidylase [Verrucomicrobiota bacterium]
MLAELTAPNCNWLSTGREVFPAMVAAIDAAQESVCLETYIYASDPLGELFREALLRALSRGARVQVLIDALGSAGLANSFWNPLREAGGEVRVFNPLTLHRLSIRNHRKLLVCDRRVAFVGGFNISSEYQGDGVTCGWCDLGLKVEGPLVAQMEASFQDMFAQADCRRKRVLIPSAKKTVFATHEQLLLSGPGRGASPIKTALRADLVQARRLDIMMAYFLPTRRLRRQIARVARHGARVRLILAGKSDVLISQLAAQSLYRRLLGAGVEIYEYQPQVLHAKLIVIDDVVYAGSANLDPRSLNLNYELMVRLESRETAAQAREWFEANLPHCQRISLEAWRHSRSLWCRLKQRWAYFLLVRIDPYIAGRQWRALPD